MKANEVLKILGITRPTLTKYVKTGLIKVNVLPTGRYNYDDNSVFSFIGQKTKKRGESVISYARVLTQSQSKQLIEQNQRIYESCISRGLDLEKQYSDIKSGMDSDRKEFQKVCQRVIKGDISLLVIENRDRLTRFGFDLLEQFFKYFGTKILVLNDEISNKSYEEELTEDLITVIDYFLMKSSFHRKELNKFRKELENNKKV